MVVTPKQLGRLSDRLETFLECCFNGMGRRERREALSHYLRGLMLDGERKSMMPIAQRLAAHSCDAVPLRQRIHEAVTVADWDERELLRKVAVKVSDRLRGVDAFVLDDTGFPKKGRHSVGVQRQYSGTMGRIDNCQIASSLHLASELGGCCIGMRLFLPERWDADPDRRRKAGIPEDVHHQPKWKIGLSLLDDALGWGLPPKVVVADAGYGDCAAFRQSVEERGLHYIVGVSGTAAVWPPGVLPKPPPNKQPGQVGRPRTKWTAPKGKTPLSIADLANSLPSAAYRRVTWREGTKGKQWNRFACIRIRTARRHSIGAPPGETQWLICEWPKSAKKPTTFYLSNLPEAIPKKRIIYLAKLRWRIERDYQEMKGELGLDHFEGRGWRGFHHHVACVAAAHAFLTLERVISPPEKTTTDASSVQGGASAGSHLHDRTLPDVCAPREFSRSTRRTLAHVIK